MANIDVKKGQQSEGKFRNSIQSCSGNRGLQKMRPIWDTKIILGFIYSLRTDNLGLGFRVQGLGSA